MNEIINHCLFVDFFFGNLHAWVMYKKGKEKITFQPFQIPCNFFANAFLHCFCAIFWTEKNWDDMVTKIVLNTIDYLREMCLDVQYIHIYYIYLFVHGQASLTKTCFTSIENKRKKKLLYSKKEQQLEYSLISFSFKC